MTPAGRPPQGCEGSTRGQKDPDGAHHGVGVSARGRRGTWAAQVKGLGLQGPEQSGAAASAVLEGGKPAPRGGVLQPHPHTERLWSPKSMCSFLRHRKEATGSGAFWRRGWGLRGQGQRLC